MAGVEYFETKDDMESGKNEAELEKSLCRARLMAYISENIDGDPEPVRPVGKASSSIPPILSRRFKELTGRDADGGYFQYPHGNSLPAAGNHLPIGSGEIASMVGYGDGG